MATHATTISLTDIVRPSPQNIISMRAIELSLGSRLTPRQTNARAAMGRYRSEKSDCRTLRIGSISDAESHNYKALSELEDEAEWLHKFLNPVEGGGHSEGDLELGDEQ
jgi:hypothetical protein